MKKEQKKEQLTLKEKLKDKKEKAKIELIIYGIFFVGIIIFARVLGSTSSKIETQKEETQSFIHYIEDNYEYDILVTLNENIYEYYGKVLGHNSTINLKVDNKVNSYTVMNKKYYALENGNYILTDEEEVYPYINYRYLNTDNIKEYINLATREGDTYKVKISDLVLGNDSEEYISITIDEGDKSLVIDYTPLLKVTDKNINRAVVNISYNNIDKIISLEE